MWKIRAYVKGSRLVGQYGRRMGLPLSDVTDENLSYYKLEFTLTPTSAGIQIATKMSSAEYILWGREKNIGWGTHRSQLIWCYVYAHIYERQIGGLRRANCLPTRANGLRTDVSIYIAHGPQSLSCGSSVLVCAVVRWSPLYTYSFGAPLQEQTRDGAEWRYLVLLLRFPVVLFGRGADENRKRARGRRGTNKEVEIGNQRTLKNQKVHFRLIWTGRRRQYWSVKNFYTLVLSWVIRVDSSSTTYSQEQTRSSVVCLEKSAFS